MISRSGARTLAAATASSSVQANSNEENPQRGKPRLNGTAHNDIVLDDQHMFHGRPSPRMQRQAAGRGRAYCAPCLAMGPAMRPAMGMKRGLSGVPTVARRQVAVPLAAMCSLPVIRRPSPPQPCRRPFGANWASQTNQIMATTIGRAAGSRRRKIFQGVPRGPGAIPPQVAAGRERPTAPTGRPGSGINGGKFAKRWCRKLQCAA